MWLAIILAAAGPPAGQPVVSAAGGETIGVVWHDQATVAPASQQRLADELAEAAAVERDAVVLDARTLAAARTALELPRSRVQQGSRWRARLDDAATTYRAGELEQAQKISSDLLAEIRSDPVVPGAASVAWQAQVLSGQLAWAQGDAEALAAALAAAVALDPDARLSTRRVPPPVVEAYERQHALALAGVQRWPSISVVAPEGEPLAVEIDGVPGQRPVPPGEHLVVVRRPGHAPVGAVIDAATPWYLPPDEGLVEPGLPTQASTAERICEHAQLTWMLLARRREGRLGLQRYSCGEGFGPAWYEQRDGTAPGLEHVLAVPEGGWEAEPVLHRADPWPSLQPPVVATPLWLVDDAATSMRRSRLRRALPWVLIGGVVAGAVTLGVVLGTDPAANLAVDGNSFLRP